MNKIVLESVSDLSINMASGSFALVVLSPTENLYFSLQKIGLGIAFFWLGVIMKRL